jgi:hypothetical protein
MSIFMLLQARWDQQESSLNPLKEELARATRQRDTYRNSITTLEANLKVRIWSTKYVRDTCCVVAVTPCRRVEATSRQRCGSPSLSRFRSVVLLATHSASMDAPSGAVLFAYSQFFFRILGFSLLMSGVRAVYPLSLFILYSALRQPVLEC